MFRVNGLDPVFASFDTPLDMATHEYTTTTNATKHTKSLPIPLAYDTLPHTDTAAILYKYIPHAGKLSGDDRSLKSFKHVLKTLRAIHETGAVHTTVPDHILQHVPSGRPCVTDPIGAVTDTDNAQLLGIGYDVASLLTRYTPTVGALPALNITTEYYSDVELIAAYNAAQAVSATVPNTSSWAIRQLRSTIDEFATRDAITEYKHVTDTSTTNTTTGSQPHSPYATKQFQRTISNQSTTDSPDTTTTTDTTPTETLDTDTTTPVRLGKHAVSDTE